MTDRRSEVSCCGWAGAGALPCRAMTVVLLVIRIPPPTALFAALAHAITDLPRVEPCAGLPVSGSQEEKNMLVKGEVVGLWCDRQGHSWLAGIARSVLRGNGHAIAFAGSPFVILSMEGRG